MSKIKYFQPKKIVEIASSTFLTIFFSTIFPAQGVEFIAPNNIDGTRIQLENRQQHLPPASTSSYLYRDTSAHRQRCSIDFKSVALVPENLYGLTASGSPSFFFYSIKYVTDSKNSNNREIFGEFILEDDNQVEIYQQDLKFDSDYGVVSIQFPSEEILPPLEVNKTYTWYLDIYTKDGESNGLVGWIKRVQLSPQFWEQLAAASPLEQAILYAETGLWYDALQILAQLRLTDSDNQVIENEWRELLASVGLDSDIFTAPLLSDKLLQYKNNHPEQQIKCI